MTAVAGRTALIPNGFRLELDRRSRRPAPGLVSGGSPLRLLKLSPAGAGVLDDLLAAPLFGAAAGALARRLTDSGIAHPRPPVGGWTGTLTVVVPVRDRASQLDKCLQSLGTDHQVVVVDDGSVAPLDVAAVVQRLGATLVRRTANGGPAAARNTGLGAVTTELVAFVDSDCTPPTGWLGALVGHFLDPRVGAVAPRIVPATSGAGGPSHAQRYNGRFGAVSISGPSRHRSCRGRGCRTSRRRL